MPLLRDGRTVEGAPRRRLGDEQALPRDASDITVPLARLADLAPGDAERTDAISLAVDDDVHAIGDETLARLHLIEIDFPAYTDGRGYSHARRLRRRGYTGEIRATGDVRIDQLLFMQRVGIDGAVLPDEPRPTDWQGTLEQVFARFDLAYQPSYPLPATSPAAGSSDSVGSPAHSA